MLLFAILCKMYVKGSKSMIWHAKVGVSPERGELRQNYCAFCTRVAHTMFKNIGKTQGSFSDFERGY